MAEIKGDHSMVSAIKEKYDSSSHEAEFCEIYVPKKGPGMTDSGRIVVPELLALDGCLISTAGPEYDIASLCQHVKELDLTKNSLNDWEEVFKILNQIPELRFLNLTCNNLSCEDFPEECRSYPNLQQLALNDTSIPWTNVGRIFPVFPSLDELHLSLNSYSTVDIAPDVCHTCVKKLYLNRNNICDWREINKVGRAFPNLENLVMGNVNVSTVCDEDGELPADIFPKLKSLNISKTNIESWQEIDKLRKFPVLSDLRVLGIPFLETYPEKERRQHLISRLPNIERLNGSRVTEAEKEDAERAFIRHYMDQDNKPERYFELEKVYGKLDPLAVIDFGLPDILDLSMFFEGKVENIPVNIRQTAAELTKNLRNYVHLPPSKFRVFLVKKGIKTNSSLELGLSPEKFLYLYNIQEGDELFVERKSKAEVKMEEKEKVVQEGKSERYFELEKVYGQLDPLANVNLAPQTLLHLNVHFGEKVETIAVDLTQTAGQFKKLLQNFVGRPLSDFRVFYEENVEHKPKYRIDVGKVPEKRLLSYNIHEGDEFRVEVKSWVGSGKQVTAEEDEHNMAVEDTVDYLKRIGKSEIEIEDVVAHMTGKSKPSYLVTTTVRHGDHVKTVGFNAQQTNVSKFKELIKDELELLSTDFRVFYLKNCDDGFKDPVELKFPRKALYNYMYPLRDTDEFYIQMD